MKVYTKQEMAEIQLERAICLILDEQDLISAITLAGAAEEILGQLLKLEGKECVLDDISNEFVQPGKITNNTWKAGAFKHELNFFRNEMKHHNRGLERMPIPFEAAYEIINRAIENFSRLTGRQSEQIKRYVSKIVEA